jgi:acyl-CoA synthetase (AMP-forming)/AMP-acid ligase II
MTGPSTVASLVQWAGAEFGTAEAVVDPVAEGTARRVSFAELAALVRRAAVGCVERGVRPGDRVAV